MSTTSLARTRMTIGCLLLAGASLFGLGCVGAPVDDEGEDDATTSDALTGDNQWIPCGYAQEIDSFGGQGVYCNNSSQTGHYQCVELAMRYENDVKHHATIWGNATDLCANGAHTSGYSVWDPNGTWGHRSAGHKPGTGDLLVWGGGSGGLGHVAVVTSAWNASGDVQYEQQNWGWWQGGRWGQVAHSSTHWDGTHSWFGVPGADVTPSPHYAKCWIHPE
jgi:hypothetical protein